MFFHCCITSVLCLTPPIHHVYDYNLKNLQELRPSGKSWHKIFVTREIMLVLVFRLWNRPNLSFKFEYITVFEQIANIRYYKNKA